MMNEDGTCTKSSLDEESSIRKFDRLDATEGFDPTLVETCQSFIARVIEEINDTYKQSLTIIGASTLIQSSIYKLDMQKEMVNVLLAAIKMLGTRPVYYIESECKLKELCSTIDWLGLRKNKTEDPIKVAVEELACRKIRGKIPRSCYLGAIELFVGALLSCLPLLNAKRIGSHVLDDGARRVVDGIIKIKAQKSCRLLNGLRL
jgi:hypothetical protein